MDGCRLAVHSHVKSLLAVHMCKSSRRTITNAGKHRFVKLSHQLEMLPLQNAVISNWLKYYALINCYLSRKIVLKQHLKQNLLKCSCSFCKKISKCWTRFAELTCQLWQGCGCSRVAEEKQCK